MSSDGSETALPPHPVLPRYYAGLRQKRAFLRDIFDQTAPDYDRVERVLAFGSGRWYRRGALTRAGLREGMHALDVAIGTGLVAREAQSIVGKTGSVTGLDPSMGMLTQARATLNIPIVLGVGEQLPFPEASFDFVSMGYALRHLSDLRKALSEYRRVLKPGGRVCLLEIVRPTNPLRRFAVEAYFRGVLPIVGRLMKTSPKTRNLWLYYWETIDQCVPANVVLEAMRAAGFEAPNFYSELGLFAEYTGTKSS
jgi:demethylmenaquinone methyltransferase/2-methoxy-6-polyprenyl-1,4-benzoquinol methylase